VADPRVPAGVLAPDGRTAAVYVAGPPTTLTLTLLDLGSGKRRTVRMTVGEGQGLSSLAWSPDGRWLFAVDASAHVFAVDPRTTRAAMLVAGLPTVRQIAVRTA
jgi:sugar lactone lactonase YvrE